MGIFDKIFGNKEEQDIIHRNHREDKMEYKMTMAQVFNPLMNKIDKLPEKEVREFLKTILDGAERSLRGILFMAPEEFNFKKTATKEEIDFWLRKVSLAILAYSCYFFSVEEQVPLGKFSYEAYWQRMFDSYNEIFRENITKNDINYYAAGLKEDTEKGYSKSGNMEKVAELAVRDYKTLGGELLQKIWQEDVSSNERKTLFLGARIWQAYQQIVQPFLPKLLAM